MFIIKSILYRLIQMIVVLFVISTLAFILMKLSPGNPVDKILHLDVAQVSTEQINATKDKLGLNDSFGSLIGGTVVIENLFDIPGIGYLLMDSIKSRDYPVIQGCVLFIGFFVVIINTIADLLTLLLDPKQRLQLGNPKNKTNTPLISESSDRHA
ncbi:TPA: ABC transporter permease subunit [Staphylococcus aureus]|nr:ABC transporter permease subunit [Staphylococcus aureus]